VRAFRSLLLDRRKALPKLGPVQAALGAAYKQPGKPGLPLMELFEIIPVASPIGRTETSGGVATPTVDHSSSTRDTYVTWGTSSAQGHNSKPTLDGWLAVVLSIGCLG